MTDNVQKVTDLADKSLLIVDDDNTFRERLSRAMEKKGFLVSQAEGVKSGIASINAKNPAFAVVDLRLGDGNGLEVVKELQKINSKSDKIQKASLKGAHQRCIVAFFSLAQKIFTVVVLFHRIFIIFIPGWD